MFLRNCWYVAAWVHEVPDQTPVGRELLGEAIVLYRDSARCVHAMADACPHRRAPLSMGRVEGDNLRCMYHGLLFDPEGACIAAPGVPTPPSCSVATYPVHVQDSWIWIWMGDRDRVDTALVPKAFGLDDPTLVMRSGQLDYDANYMLVNDNLCDLSHVDFVHETTLGHITAGGWSDGVPRVRPLPRGIRTERWFVGKPASPGNPRLVDTWSTYDYLAPGVFVMENRSYPHGMAADCAHGAPQATPMTYRVEQQAVTPISETRTRYLYATGFDSSIPARLLDGIFETIMATFAEDRAMIEAQQRVWDRRPPHEPMVFIPHDKGPSMFRRAMNRLMADERAGG